MRAETLSVSGAAAATSPGGRGERKRAILYIIRVRVREFLRTC